MSKGLNYEQNYSFLFEIVTLLGYYVAYVGSCLLMLRDSLWVPFSGVKQSWNAWCLKMGNLKSWNVMFIGDITYFPYGMFLKNYE
jgi:hypothetical protein